MKIAPLHREFDRRKARISYKLIHTGQHYDERMSGGFFRDLAIRKPDFHLETGSGSHAEQTGRIMIAVERILMRERPDLVVVVGDVNSTMAAALAAVKLQIPVAHVEAGCRSFDRTMPEEINRIVTDGISDLLFTIDSESRKNLRREGVESSKIHVVGDIMIDSLQHALRGIRREPRGDYGILTLHRPSNVDDLSTFAGLMRVIAKISRKTEIIFPVHPRTRNNLETSAVRSALKNSPGLKCVPPMGYNTFARLLAGARFVLTDSGSLQQETSFLDIPCLTLRENTERPVTLSHGANVLVGRDESKIMHRMEQVFSGRFRHAKKIPHWDGRTASRITKVILRTNL